MTTPTFQSDPPADPGCLPLDALRRLVAVELPPELLSEAVVRVADAIRADGALDRLPILADALEDAGCADELLLAHCRAGDPHRPDCWVVELVREATPQPPPTRAEVVVRVVDRVLARGIAVRTREDSIDLFRAAGGFLIFAVLGAGCWLGSSLPFWPWSIAFVCSSSLLLAVASLTLAWFRVTRAVRR